jgi:SSS family solute:Na+ symporter
VAYFTQPESDEVLDGFCRRVRPWGFRAPVHERIAVRDPGFQKNTDFVKDMVNVAVGLIWQIALVACPLFLVTWDLSNATLAGLVIVVAMVFPKWNWWNKLKIEDDRYPA